MHHSRKRIYIRPPAEQQAQPEEEQDDMEEEEEEFTDDEGPAARYLGIRVGIFVAIVILLGFMTQWLFGAEVRFLSNVFLNHITVGTLSAFVLAGGWAILQALWSLNLCGFHPHSWSFDGKDAAMILLVIVAVIGALYLLYQLIRGLYEVAQAGQQVASATIYVRNKEMRKRVVERYRVLNYCISPEPEYSERPEAKAAIENPAW
ncbi:hypothetical protein AK812_SmicGene17226 [Symbiodinium microadriaticum]|uniref:Uncharacterized protein n=1 Tax=Symbiodinium microadriaticum TaxID=2951 RepID=A0A1Q9DY67_SYMMI|nr:hypothetical protein AK812_SmicGene17226 [Symbiodinium microadriaticum]